MKRTLLTVTFAGMLATLAMPLALPFRSAVAQAPTSTGAGTPQLGKDGATAPSSTQSSTPTDGSTATPPGEVEVERVKIWNSPEMEQARAYIEGYALRSARFQPKDAAAYLAKLRQMSPADMKAWLERFKVKQASLARSAAVAKAGRQMAIDRALAEHEAVQQSYANLKLNQTAAAQMNDQRVEQQQQLGRQMASARDAFRSEQATTMMHSPDYSWIIDPPYYTRVAAAATLPGDLPRGDPTNFIRGDVVGPEVIGGEAAAASAAAAAAAAR